MHFDNWPPQLYIRSSNRLRGMVVMTQNNLASPRSKKTSVAMGCWELDQHTMTRYAILDKKDGMRYAVNEGFFRHGVDPTIPPKSMAGLEPYNLWYDVPFEVVLPKRNQCTNLMIPVALSASSVAFSSMRIETMYMDLGTAVGVASRQFFIRNNSISAVQDVHIETVQRTLEVEFRQRTKGPFWR